MKLAQAIALLSDAVGGRTGVWADFGAGDGRFTRALARLLGPTSTIYAVDKDPRAIAELTALSQTDPSAARVIPLNADFTQPFQLPPPHDLLDGMLLANALHFVADAGGVLAQLAARLRPGGRVVLVEYDRRAANRWVPYPIPMARLYALAATAQLTVPVVTATRPSAFSGILYAAAADRRVQ